MQQQPIGGSQSYREKERDNAQSGVSTGSGFLPCKGWFYTDIAVSLCRIFLHHNRFKVSSSIPAIPAASSDNKCAVIVGVRWLAQYKCGHYSSRHSCDRVELACSFHLSACASSCCFHPCLSRSRSPFISFNLPPLRLSPTSFPQPLSLSLSPPCCLVKMTECEDMMEYFLSSLWISLCVDPHAHTAANAHARMHTFRGAHASYQGLLSQSISDVIDLSRLSMGRLPHTATEHGQGISWEEIWGWVSLCGRERPESRSKC